MKQFTMEEYEQALRDLQNLCLGYEVTSNTGAKSYKMLRNGCLALQSLLEEKKILESWKENLRPVF